MVWLACRKAWILSRLSFSASCTLVVNPPACHPLQAHLVLESHLPFRLILYWLLRQKRRPRPLRLSWANLRYKTFGTAPLIDSRGEPLPNPCGPLQWSFLGI